MFNQPQKWTCYLCQSKQKEYHFYPEIPSVSIWSLLIHSLCLPAQSQSFPSMCPWHLDCANGRPRWANRVWLRLWSALLLPSCCVCRRRAALPPLGPDLHRHTWAPCTGATAQHWFREIYKHLADITLPYTHRLSLTCTHVLTADIYLQIPWHSSSFIRSPHCAKMRVIREEQPSLSSVPFYCFSLVSFLLE